MEFQEHAKTKRDIYLYLIDYIENKNSTIQNDKLLLVFLDEYNIQKNRSELMEFLCLISKISKNHHRDEFFHERIKQIILHYEPAIKQTMSNLEIFNTFKSDKIILLLLFERQILTVDEYITRFFVTKSDQKFCHFFYPEIEGFLKNEEKVRIKNELILTDPEIFQKKRQIGENDSLISTLIRHDSVEEFISLINRYNISLESEIKPSVYETNSFLMKRSPSLIEYAAFFGSIQIFQFLRLNKVELNSSLWLYVIHSQNAELIHLLEENEVPLEDESYDKYWKESIKCHHNDFASYFMDKKNVNDMLSEKVLKSSYHYFNYTLILDDQVAFFYWCKYGYFSIVNHLLNCKEKEIQGIIEVTFCVLKNYVPFSLNLKMTFLKIELK